MGILYEGQIFFSHHKRNRGKNRRLEGAEQEGKLRDTAPPQIKHSLLESKKKGRKKQNTGSGGDKRRRKKWGTRKARSGDWRGGSLEKGQTLVLEATLTRIGWGIKGRFKIYGKRVAEKKCWGQNKSFG